MRRLINRIFVAMFGAVMAALAGVAGAQESFNALSWRQSLAFNSYLMQTVHEQYRLRNESFGKALSSRSEMQSYIDACRSRYRSIAGAYHYKKEDLNAKTVGVLEVGGIRIENIIFESLRGRYVTATMYLPAHFEGKIPAVLQFCGHGTGGKMSESPTAPALALNGIATIIVDPVGQGERLQLINHAGEALTRGSTTEHTLLNTGLNLIGTSLAIQEFWDNHRALDYLISRKDIDADRIGVFGSSGGGTQTAYFIGLDERVKASAICSYFSMRERTLELQGASDGCQHIPYEGREQLELADFVLMSAPNPSLILTGKYDFVDLWGARQGFEQLKKAYTILGIPDRVDMLTVETGHGLGDEKRKRLVAWFRQWLLGAEADFKDFPLPEIDMNQLYCTPAHQVNIAFDDAKSIMQENIKRAEEMAVGRSAFLKQGLPVVQQKVRELLGMGNVSPLKIISRAAEVRKGYRQYRFELIREGEMPLPCVMIMPDKAGNRVRIALSTSGKSSYLNEKSNIMTALDEGAILIAADLRGIGETADPPQYNDAKYMNFEYRNAMISMHAGKPIMGQRVQDVLTLLDFCTIEKELSGQKLHIEADGLYVPVVIHAAFLDKRIDSAELRGIHSWTDYIENPLQADMYSSVLYGALQFYDLPDLIKLSGNRVHYNSTTYKQKEED